MSKDKLIELLKSGSKPVIKRQEDGVFKEFVIDEIEKLNQISSQNNEKIETISETISESVLKLNESASKNKKLAAELISKFEKEVFELSEKFSTENKENIYSCVTENLSLLQQDFLVKINLLKKSHSFLSEKIEKIESSLIQSDNCEEIEKLNELKLEFQQISKQLNEKINSLDQNLKEIETKFYEMVLKSIDDTKNFIVSNSNTLIESMKKPIERSDGLPHDIKNLILDSLQDVANIKDFNENYLSNEKEREDDFIEFSKLLVDKYRENKIRLNECEDIVIALTKFTKKQIFKNRKKLDVIYENIDPVLTRKNLDNYYLLLTKNAENIEKTNSHLKKTEENFDQDIKHIFENFNLFENKINTIEGNLVGFLQDSIGFSENKLTNSLLETKENIQNKISELENKLYESISENKKTSKIFKEIFEQEKEKVNKQLVELKEKNENLKLENKDILNQIDFVKSKVDKFTDSLLEKISVHKKLTSESITKIISASISEIDSEIKNLKEGSILQQKLFEEKVVSVKSLIEKQKSEIFEEIMLKVAQLITVNNEKTNNENEIKETILKVISENNLLQEKAEMLDIKIDPDDIKKVFEENPDFLKSLNCIPDHQYKDGYLRFEKPDGSWGEPIKLYGMAHYYTGGGANVIPGTALLSIYDEGVLVKDKVEEINFIGASVVAVSTGPTTSRVNVFIPPPAYASHFNTNDGTTDAIVDDIATYQRYASQPNLANLHEVGTWDLTITHPCINVTTLNYSTPDFFSLETQNTTFDVDVVSPTGIIHASRTVTISGNSNTTQNGITIVVTEYQADSNLYKCKISVTFNLATIIPIGGRIIISMIHHNSSADYTKTQDLFFDAHLNNATISGITISENTPSIVYLSGIQYYGTGSTFNFNISDIDWLNDKSYPLVQVEVQASDFGLPNLSLTGPQLTNWDRQWNNINSSYSISNYTVNRVNYCYVGNATSRARTIDWTASAYVNGNIIGIAINTLTDNSTRIYENFITEAYRLKSDLLTSWNSTEDLHVADDGTGAQLRCSYLIYPTIDYTSYTPGLTENFDYSNITGTRTYYRRFWHPSVTWSNGELTLTGIGITELNFGANFNIRWSINRVDWFNLNADYEGGELIPNAGSRINRDTINLSTGKIAFTMGENKFSSEIWIEITLMNNVVEINTIGINWV